MQNANPENFVGWDSNLHNGREGNQGSRNDDCVNGVDKNRKSGTCHVLADAKQEGFCIYLIEKYRVYQRLRLQHW